jgi:ribosomal protein S18 acetylase RimI-like enzyme
MKVEQVRNCDDALLIGVNALLPQLSCTARPLSQSEIKTIVDSDTAYLLVARDDNKICGMLTLIVFRIPTGVRAWIEDVVVSESSRGKGVGKSLLASAANMAREQGARTLDLTSRPEREAANRLYRKAGFVQRDTNVYRIVL